MPVTIGRTRSRRHWPTSTGKDERPSESQISLGDTLAEHRIERGAERESTTKRMQTAARGPRATHSWGNAKTGDFREPSNYQTVLEQRPIVELTRTDVNEFLATFPHADTKDKSARSHLLRWMNPDDDLGRPLRQSTDVLLDDYMCTVDRVRTPNELAVVESFFPNGKRRTALTTHDRYRDLWTAISAWDHKTKNAPALKGYNSGNGYFCHAIRLADRVSWWLLNNKDVSCDRWTASKWSSSQACNSDRRVSPPADTTVVCTQSESTCRATDEPTDESTDSAPQLELALTKRARVQADAPPSPSTTANELGTEQISRPSLAEVDTEDASTEVCGEGRVRSDSDLSSLRVAVCDVDAALQPSGERSLSWTHIEKYSEMHMRARRSMEAEANPLTNAPMVALRTIPHLINHPSHQKQMSPQQVWSYIDKQFSSMTKKEYEKVVRTNKWRGLEAYYEPHPRKETGYRPIGRQTGTRAAHIDHVFAQHYCPFEHPRFYVVVPSQINIALKDMCPSARVGFGLCRSVLRDMCSDVRIMIDQVRKRRLFDDLYANLPSIQDNSLA